MTTLRVAAAAWPIEQHDGWASFAGKCTRWVEDACKEGAELLLFPEYGSMELTSLLPSGCDLHRSIAEMQPLFPGYCKLWQMLAEQYGVIIVAPSYPVLEDDQFFNQAWVFSPEAPPCPQSKLHMTRFEAEHWGIESGSGLIRFDMEGPQAAIAICYDVEFPDQVRALTEAGSNLVLVPSCTDTEAGYTRVSISARARAIENQCFVVQAVTVGEAPWSPAVDVNIGAAGIFCPADRGFPANGILALGEMNKPGWTFATLDFGALEKVRTEGQVLNHRDGGSFDYDEPDVHVLTRSL